MSIPFFTEQPLVVTTSLTTTGKIMFTGYVAGRVIIPNGFSMTSLTWYESNEKDGDYVLCVDAATLGVQTVAAGTAGQSYRIPVQLIGSGFLKAVGSHAETILITLTA